MNGNETVQKIDQDVPTPAAQPGKYLTFQLDREVYGLEILKVQEIIGMMKVTRVPRMPAFVRGVMNLRGKIIPLVDLRLKFELPRRPDTEKTCIVVVQVVHGEQVVTVGVIVDEVSEVLDVAADQIEPPLVFGRGARSDFILGMGKIGRKVVMLLDVDRVLSNGELAVVDKVAQNP